MLCALGEKRTGPGISRRGLSAHDVGPDIKRKIAHTPEATEIHRYRQ